VLVNLLCIQSDSLELAGDPAAARSGLGVRCPVSQRASCRLSIRLRRRQLTAGVLSAISMSVYISHPAVPKKFTCRVGKGVFPEKVQIFRV